jgi:hypothetical protein
VLRFRSSYNGAVAGREQSEHGVDIVFRQVSVSIDQQRKLIDNAADSFERSIFALQKQLIASGSDLGIWKCQFDTPQVDVIESEKQEGLCLLNLDALFCQSSLVCLGEISDAHTAL